MRNLRKKRGQSMAYNIIVAPRALRDLDEVAEYVGETLLAPDAARGLVSRIIEAIGGLAEFPLKGAKVEFEFVPDFEVRRLVVDEFLVFYRVDEAQRTVYVLRIRYGRTDYIRHLEL